MDEIEVLKLAKKYIKSEPMPMGVLLYLWFSCRER